MNKLPCEIKNHILIALDLDDCIIPWVNFDSKVHTQYDFQYTIKETEKNILIIENFRKKLQENTKLPVKYILTSSWSNEIDENFNLKIQNKKIYEILWNIIISTIRNNLISKDPFNDRIIYIDSLIDNNFIICIDDRDLSSFYEKYPNFFMLNIVNGNYLQEKLNKNFKIIMNSIINFENEL